MNYKETIESAPLVLVEFYATWCPHCQRMMPVVKQIKELLEGSADVYQFDIDQYQDLADSINVSSVPTFIIYKNGEEKWRESGELSGQELLSKVQLYI